MMMIYRMKKQMCWTWSGERKERKELMNERINDILIAPTVQDLIFRNDSFYNHQQRGASLVIKTHTVLKEPRLSFSVK